MLKTKRKRLLAVLALLAFILLTYATAWLRFYARSMQYYRQAMANYRAGSYIDALKGKKAEKPDGSGYVYQGGMQEVVDIWNSGYAYPKPAVYASAVKTANTIINEKIDAKTGLAAFQKYFKTDNEYLPQILFRVAALCVAQGDTGDAKQIYDTIAEAFPTDKASVAQAKALKAKLPAARP